MKQTNIKTQFGLTVKKIRTERNISQEKLALLCSIDRSYMGRIERGEVNITLERLYELANALNIPVYELLPNPLE